MEGSEVRPVRLTVYPSRGAREKGWGFPPASFWNFADAYRYARDISDSTPPCGICMCPADSYFVHNPEETEN